MLKGQKEDIRLLRLSCVKVFVYQRINVFEQWCYRRMLRIQWSDKVSNEVIQRMKETELHQ